MEHELSKEQINNIATLRTLFIIELRVATVFTIDNNKLIMLHVEHL